MTNKNKKPSEELIKSVLNDLSNETEEPSQNNEKTTILGGSSVPPSSSPSNPSQSSSHSANEADDARTVLASSTKKPSPSSESSHEPKVSFGGQKPAQRSSSYEPQFVQAENLKIAQQRIFELEKDIERLRKENEALISAGEITQQKLEELSGKVNDLERSKHELKEQNESELKIFREGLQVKDNEILRLRNKVDELESRLGNDLKKIRVRERELENRLELSKLEKSALSRSKDETILDLKRRTDHLNAEIENYKNRVVDLHQKLQANHEQFGRTVRALRIALTNLEVNENGSSITIAPIKKAE